MIDRRVASSYTFYDPNLNYRFIVPARPLA